jgi:hypothetical protein
VDVSEASETVTSALENGVPPMEPDAVPDITYVIGIAAAGFAKPRRQVTVRRKTRTFAGSFMKASVQMLRKAKH